MSPDCLAGRGAGRPCTDANNAARTTQLTSAHTTVPSPHALCVLPLCSVDGHEDSPHPDDPVVDLKDATLSHSLHAWWAAVSPHGSPLTQQLYNAFAQWLVEVRVAGVARASEQDRNPCPAYIYICCRRPPSPCP